jgi:hypothetical protein
MAVLLLLLLLLLNDTQRNFSVLCHFNRLIQLDRLIFRNLRLSWPHFIYVCLEK